MNETMKLTSIEHFDRFDDETIFWAELSGLPKQVQDRAKAIDGEMYSPNCFGICAFHNHTSGEWDVVTDTDLSTGESRNIYYVDNNGDKHWFKTKLPEGFMEQLFEACARVSDGRDALQGYEVKASILFENGTGMALAENPEASQPFSTWMFSEDQYGRRDYEWCRYFQDKGKAVEDFRNRTDNYRRSHEVQEVKRPISQQIQAAKALQTKGHDPAKPKRPTTREER